MRGKFFLLLQLWGCLQALACGCDPIIPTLILDPSKVPHPFSGDPGNDIKEVPRAG